jgi:hypothetical protein
LKTFKNTLAILLVTFISLNVNAQKTGCVVGDCEFGTGKFIKTNTETTYEYYYGVFINGKLNDTRGTHHYEVKDEIERTYTGGFKDGEYHGLGTLRNVYGYVYDGNWKNGKRNGFGSASLKDYYVYDGNWKNNMKHGKGTYKDLRTNTIQEGTWINDEFQE